MEPVNGIEELAALSHEQWSLTVTYMLDNMTPENIERWRRQANTSYSELSDKEKESDRMWALRAWAIMNKGDAV